MENLKILKTILKVLAIAGAGGFISGKAVSMVILEDWYEFDE